MKLSLIAAFITYFGVLFIIGFVSWFRTRASKDFLLGARSINYWVTAIAAHASDMSAWLFMGFPAAIYLHGLVDSWIAIGLIGGMLTSWHLIAQKLRTMTESFESLTLSSFLEKRFNDSTGVLSVVSSLIKLYFFAIYVAAGLTGMGFLFESVFDVSYHIGMLVGLMIALFYILVGGFIAVAWSHFFQGIFLLIVIVTVPLYAFYHLGSTVPITLFAHVRHIELSAFPLEAKDLAKHLLSGIAWGLGYFGMPHIVVNFMGIDKPENIYKAKYVGMAWLVLSLTAAIAIGYVSIGYFPEIDNSELVFVYLVQQLFNPFMAGLILCAILAATMSTIDTQILVASSALSQDILKKMFPHSNEKRDILMFRISILIVALFSFCIAAQKNSSVMGYVSYAWSGLGSAFSPVMLAALYTNFVNKWGALASILLGALVAGIWPIFDNTFLPLIPGFFVSACSLVMVSVVASLINPTEKKVTHRLN